MIVNNDILLNNNKIGKKIIKKIIVKDIYNFMQKIGKDFGYVTSDYKIIIDYKYYYIDLLLFNVNYNCFVIVKILNTKMKEEEIKRLQIYMDYIDKNVKNISNNITIGIIIKKRKNKLVLEYSSDPRIKMKEYTIKI